ncbi:hypothetical protein BU23DRAFT_240752 [Bimuria novae-zelandiae CBS 107.79]|uniref:Uncharacterized protein n=1 Tax=Bimuria novae-zelandiae CBS 107.79 TaxID=1447943 RepID=A0A6A5UW46_9PLEO|nr:hypothetical protein BU23DRAFT_240752 [Bimuria novae-zelandiae CBS 107.79]
MPLRLWSRSSRKGGHQPCTDWGVPLALSLNLAVLQTSLRVFVTIQTHAIVLLQTFGHLPDPLLRALPPCVRLSDGELVPCLHSGLA